MFFPYRDKNPSGTLPIVTIAIIVVNVLAFFYELSLGYHLEEFVYSYGVVPARVLHFSSWTFKSAFLPFGTSMFLHAGFLHLAGNMWFLWLFGDNVEDRLGHLRFLAFYFASGVGASIIFVLFNKQSILPCIGASGAIAGVLGAYMITFPRARVKTLIMFFFFWQTVELPAIAVLGVWFAIQFLNAMATPTVTGGGVAWWAHIGGFIIGIVLMNVFPKRKPGEEWWSF